MNKLIKQRSDLISRLDVEITKAMMSLNDKRLEKVMRVKSKVIKNYSMLWDKCGKANTCLIHSECGSTN
jgi:hypothetical protein